jgi:hypothetical protein
MKTFPSRLLLAAGLVAGMITGAQATTVLGTAPAAGSYGHSYLDCSVVNGSDVAPAIVTIEGISYAGGVVNSEVQRFLPPKGTYILLVDGSAASCRFTVLAGSKKAIHGAAIYVRDMVGNVDMVVPAR